MDLKKAQKALCIIHSILTDNNVDYFVNFGTLLGIIREGHVIEHDTDIDIAIIGCTKKNKELLISSFKNYGFKFAYEIRDYEFFSFQFNFIKIDFTHYEIKTNSLVHESQKLSMADVYPILQIEIENYEFNVPKNYKKLLRIYYGPNWQIPNRGFHYDSKRSLILKFLYKYTFTSVQHYLRALKDRLSKNL